MSKLKKSLIAMIILTIFIVLIFSAIGMELWRSNMAIQIDASASYIFGETDLTDIINYSSVTNTYILGYIFTVFGALSGMYISVALWIVYGFVLLAIHYVRKIKARKRSDAS